jgi:hypothetical protein
MIEDRQDAEDRRKEPFGISVRDSVFWLDDENIIRVSLPHQCDSWDIAAGTPSEVLAELRRFREELDEAIWDVKIRVQLDGER